MPVDNRAGRGLNPRPERSTPAKYLPRFQIRKCITRNKSFNLFSILYFFALAWVDRSGRGFNPRPAQGRPASINPDRHSRPAQGRPAQGRNDPPTLNVRPQFQNRKGITRNESSNLFSAICSSALAWVDRSGRGFNPRPAQRRPAQGPAQTGSSIDNAGGRRGRNENSGMTTEGRQRTGSDWL